MKINTLYRTRNELFTKIVKYYLSWFFVVINEDINISEQIVSCAKCRYQYELVSGDIVSIQSEEIRLVSHIIYSMTFSHLGN
jgi:hypothetical protein